MEKRITETEALFLLVAAQLIQAADKAPGALRKRLQMRGEQCLDAADAEAAKPQVGPYSFEDIGLDARYAGGNLADFEDVAEDQAQHGELNVAPGPYSGS